MLKQVNNVLTVNGLVEQQTAATKNDACGDYNMSTIPPLLLPVYYTIT